MQALLSIDGLHKSFGALKAVQNMSLQVPAGEVTAVIGPNGAGKTTLFNCVSGALRPDSGTIALHPPSAQAPIRLEAMEMEAICRHGVARTFQQVRLFDSLSVVDNVVLGGLHRDDMGWCAAVLDRLAFRRRRHLRMREDAMEILRRVGLDKHALQLAGNLDHGNRRRIEIARALAARPLVLLLDEPAAGMNRVETDELMALLHTLCREGMAVLLIEHDMKLVMQIANRVYVMDHGVPLCSGSPPEVTSDTRVVEAYLGSMGRKYVAR